MKPIPEGVTVIVNTSSYAVWTFPIDGEPYITLRGLDATDYVFNKRDWDIFSSVIRLADMKIQEEKE